MLQGSHDDVFRTVHGELETRFGSIGAVVQGLVHFDFETAAINSFQQTFPEVAIRGCLFHFTQAVQRTSSNGS